MKLSDRDRAILSTIQYHGDEAIAGPAAALGFTESAVRRVVTRALDTGVLRRRVYVNSFALGFHQYSIFFSANARTATQRARLRDLLVQSPATELVLEVGGQFNYGIVVTARSVFEAEAFLENLTRDDAISLSGVRIHARTGWHYFGVKYLGSSPSARTTAIVPGTAIVTLAPGDAEVLHAFGESPDGNRQRIARSLGMPLSTLSYRIDRLRTSGVIAGVLYQIVADTIGYEAFRVLVETSSPSRAYRTALLKWAQAHPAVLTFMHGFGNWNYELRIETRDTRAARAAVDELQDRFPEFIGTTELVPVSRVLKLATTPHARLLR